MSEIFQTKQQRANTLEALNVMWPSVPPKNVSSHLSVWRNEASRRKKLGCNSLACFGGWCAAWPPFKELGIVTDSDGMPHLGDTYGVTVAGRIFGSADMFAIRGLSSIDDGFAGTDHELVTHRLQWLLENSVVKP